APVVPARGIADSAPATRYPFSLLSPCYRVLFSASSKESLLGGLHLVSGRPANVMVPLVYSPRYNITAFGLERLHPFDSRKYRRIRDWLVRQGLRRPGDFVTPPPCTHTDLLRVHTPEYLDSLRQRRILAHILEVPVVRFLPGWLVSWRVLRPM